MTDADIETIDNAPTDTVYLAELQCFLCGSLAGSIESDRKPLPPYGIWHPADGGPLQRESPTGASCAALAAAARCYAESVEAVVRHDEAEELRREAPRRGRPPKWLVEERRQAREDAESRL